MSMGDMEKSTVNTFSGMRLVIPAHNSQQHQLQQPILKVSKEEASSSSSLANSHNTNTTTTTSTATTAAAAFPPPKSTNNISLRLIRLDHPAPSSSNLQPPPPLRPQTNNISALLLSQPDDSNNNNNTDIIDEISIFEAKKYFNDVQHHNINHHQLKQQDPKINAPHSPNLMNRHLHKHRGGDHVSTIQRGISSSSSPVVVVTSSSSPSSLSYGGSDDHDEIYDGRRRKDYNFRSNSRSSFQSTSTPTASSEASWNSHSGLLIYNHRRPPNPTATAAAAGGSAASSVINKVQLQLVNKKQNKNNTGSRLSTAKSCLLLFGPKCCFTKKSIQVQVQVVDQEDYSSIPNTTTPLHHGHQQLDFINSNASSSSSLNPIEKQRPKATTEEEELETSHEMTKSKLLTGNWAHDHHHRTPKVIGNRVVPPGRSFVDGAGGGFSFPIFLENAPAAGRLASQAGHLTTQKSLASSVQQDDSVQWKKSEAQGWRKLMSLPGDYDRRSFMFPMSPKNRKMMTKDEDMESDTSSDLFEIESLSTQTSLNPATYYQRDHSDEFSGYNTRRRSLDKLVRTQSVAPTEVYEPSEASIDWSVTTAEGFSSVTNLSLGAASCYAQEIDFTCRVPIPSNRNTGGGKRLGNGLLGCRRENSVKVVGPNPVKHVPEKCFDYGRSSFPVESGRIDAMLGRLGNPSSMQVVGKASSVKPPLSRSRSARMYSHV